MNGKSDHHDGLFFLPSSQCGFAVVRFSKSHGARYVGYSQDSMTAAEFDITDALTQSRSPSPDSGGLGCRLSLASGNKDMDDR